MLCKQTFSKIDIYYIYCSFMSDCNSKKPFVLNCNILLCKGLTGLKVNIFMGYITTFQFIGSQKFFLVN